MNTRTTIITSALALGVVAGSAGIASALTGSGSATQSQSTQEDPTAVAPDGAITSDEAGQVALAAYPGSTLVQIDLEDEDGVVVYEVNLTDAAGAGLEVEVDAINGSILDHEADDQDDANEADDANEGPETSEGSP